MSRHRFVRNIDLHEELQEDENDYDLFEGITPEQQDQLDAATDAVLAVLGPVPFVREHEIRESLWDNYFDVHATSDWALEEQDKRRAAKEKREKKAAASKQTSPSTPKKNAGSSSGKSTPATTPSSKKSVKISSAVLSNLPQSQLQADFAGLNLTSNASVELEPAPLPPPKMSLSREKVLEEARKALEWKEGSKKALNIVIIGHVDAGKSTLMGRLVYDLGQMGEKKRRENERESNKVGKGSFQWAWEMDAMGEERDRGVTIDINQTTLNLPNTALTILDAPGHKDFVPNMISGASQADAALLVVDAATGEFEAGFAGGGQSREHVILVRSLGVSSIVVAVNKLDMAAYSKDRYDEICSTLKPFLQQSGYLADRIAFIPCAGMAGVNLLDRDAPGSEGLRKWYKGPTLVEALDTLRPPNRPIELPLRFPISNVFKGGGATSVSSGIGVSGRVVSGVVQAGERLRILPGDETAIVRSIERDDASAPWAAAGSNVTLYLANVDPIHLNIGSVLCPENSIVPLASSFVAQLIIFDIKVPIITGTSVELFHHSRDNPATISKLLAIVDRASGNVLKSNPRVLAKNMSAKVQVTLRSGTMSGPSVRPVSVPIEPFSINKDMGRVLLRRNGETVAAGIVTELLS